MKLTRVGAGWLLGLSQRTTGVPLDELELEELLDEEEELEDELELDEELDELELDEDDELLEAVEPPPQPTSARVTAAVNAVMTMRLMAMGRYLLNVE